MKISIFTNKNDFLDFTCDSMKVENGFLILTNPVNKANVTTKEFWLAISNIYFINVIEKEEEKNKEDKNG
jgi:hypothetical protein